MSWAVAGSIGLGAIGTLANTYMQWKNLNYQKDLQKDIFGREDSSIVRRVADLKRAGLSPVLAAGQGANAGSTIQTQAPQIEDIPSKLLTSLSLMKMSEEIQNTQAQRDLIKSQDVKTNLESAKVVTETNRNKIENAIAEKDFLRYKVTNINPRNASMPGKIFTDTISGGSEALKQGTDFIKKGWNTYDAEMYKIQKKIENYFKKDGK